MLFMMRYSAFTLHTHRTGLCGHPLTNFYICVTLACYLDLLTFTANPLFWVM